MKKNVLHKTAKCFTLHAFKAYVNESRNG